MPCQSISMQPWQFTWFDVKDCQTERKTSDLLQTNTKVRRNRSLILPYICIAKTNKSPALAFNLGNLIIEVLLQQTSIASKYPYYIYLFNLYRRKASRFFYFLPG